MVETALEVIREDLEETLEFSEEEATPLLRQETSIELIENANEPDQDVLV